ncbi:hypothetical protein NQZ68_018199 [Dissostichus eleginoides]|nr:hypothetical protein NQZ68_018199 [Dissostichus eleginoides]
MLEEFQKSCYVLRRQTAGGLRLLFPPSADLAYFRNIYKISLSSCLSPTHSSPKSPTAAVLSSLLERGGTGLLVLER